MNHPDIGRPLAADSADPKGTNLVLALARVGSSDVSGWVRGQARERTPGDRILTLPKRRTLHRSRCSTVGCLGGRTALPTVLRAVYRRASFTNASAAFPATTQFADPATTASSSNQRYPKLSIHSGKSGLMIT